MEGPQYIFLNSKLTHGRARRASVDQDTRRALDVRRASLLATVPVLRITYQSCSPRSSPSADTFTKNVLKFEGCRR